MDSGRDTSVYSAKKTYNRLIGKVDYSHTNTHTQHTHSHSNPHMLISLLLFPLQHPPSPFPFACLPNSDVKCISLGLSDTSPISTDPESLQSEKVCN